MQSVVLATGGTGGHIFPALAVAEEIRRRYPQVSLLFLGAKRGPERRLSQEAGLEFHALPAKGVLGRGLRSLGSVSWLFRSLVQASLLYRKRRPDVVLGLGGYAGFAPLLAAHWGRIPCAIHEQNSIPGVTNRVLAKRVDKTLLSIQDQFGYFPPEKSVWTGNPVRQEVAALRQDQSNRQINPSEPRVLFFGGSQGAKGINASVLSALPSFSRGPVHLWHQTGFAEYEEIKEAYVQAGLKGRCRVEPFIEDMASAYAWADLVVCRAGATSIAELTTIGKPAILVPFPYATHDHQRRNAAFLESAGAAMVLTEDYLSEVNLARVIADLVDLPGKLREMAGASRRIGTPRAAAAVVDELEALIGH